MNLLEINLNEVDRLIDGIASVGDTLFVSAAWRDTKMIFEKLNDSKYTKVHRVDCCVATSKQYGTKLTFIPIGNGDKIKGIRVKNLVIVEKDNIAQDVLEAIIAGHYCVHNSPLEQVKKQKLEELRGQTD